MNTQAKTFVSYLGGSGGDLLCASLNGLPVTFGQPGYVNNQAFTVKTREPVTSADDLAMRAQAIDHAYVSTHEFLVLLNAALPMINVTVRDPATAEIMILRQMTLQHLQIRVDTNSHWFMITRNLCLADRPEAAAEHWLIRARALWHDHMRQRLECSVPELCVDRLFDPDFCCVVTQQCPGLDSATFRDNHKEWLLRNHAERWSQETALQNMTRQLRTMDWHQTQGLIRYQ